MDKKDLENLSVSELFKLKESINDEIEKKRTQQTLSTANRKGLSSLDSSSNCNCCI